MNATSASKTPIIIGHRGACGERPENTMASFRLAISQGADAIEPDLVVTKDGVLVCRHENELSSTTDVAARAEFSHLRKSKMVEHQNVEGWFAEDFTLAELKTLRCRERLPQLRPESAHHDGEEAIPTFAEVLALGNESGVGIYAELKHAAWFAASGIDLMPAFIAAVRGAGGQSVADRLFVQSFDISPLFGLAIMSSIRWNCVQLIAPSGAPFDRPEQSYAEMLSDAGLQTIAQYARAISVEKSHVLPWADEGRALPATDLCARAHRAGLQINAWTFRPENIFLPSNLRRGDAADPAFAGEHGDMSAELHAAFAAGVDGVFCDFPALAVAARN